MLQKNNFNYTQDGIVLIIIKIHYKCSEYTEELDMFQDSKMLKIPDDTNKWKSFTNVDVYQKDGPNEYSLYKPKGITIYSLVKKTGFLPDDLFLPVEVEDEILLTNAKSQREKVLLTKNPELIIEFQKEMNDKLGQTLNSSPHKAKEVLTEFATMFSAVPNKEVLEKSTSTVSVIMDNCTSNPDILKTLNSIVLKDYSTSVHVVNVMFLCIGFAHYQRYSTEAKHLFALKGLLHDVGKLFIPHDILTAPRGLTKDEFSQMKEHSRKGYDILSKTSLPQSVALSALNHHEKIDGSGYPNGKKDEEIDYDSQVLGMIDIFEALTNKRPYKNTMNPFEALRIISEDVEKGKLGKKPFKDFVQSIVGITYWYLSKRGGLGLLFSFSKNFSLNFF